MRLDATMRRVPSPALRWRTTRLAAEQKKGEKEKHFVQEKDRGSIGGARIRTPPRERRATGARAAMFNMCRRATFPHWTAGWTTE